MTTGQRWLFVAVCVAVALAVNTAFHLTRRRPRSEGDAMDPLPKIGRCQHCQQTRPVFPYTATFDNGEPIWTTPCPDYWTAHGVWLCTRDWSQAETCRVNGRTFHVEHGLIVFAEDEPRTRIWAGGRELLSQADEDLNTCKAILVASERTRP